MSSGLVFNVVPKFFEFMGWVELPSYLNPVIIGTVVSLVVTIAVSRRTTVTEEESKQLARLHMTPADEIDSKRTRGTLIAPAVLAAYGIIMSFLMINFYVRPLQEARGELLADGSINFMTGEAMLAVSWLFLYSILGWFVARVIRGNYSPPGKGAAA